MKDPILIVLQVIGEYVTYRNEIVYLDHGIKKWTVPLQCKRQRTTRIANYHLYPNKRSLSLGKHSVLLICFIGIRLCYCKFSDVFINVVKNYFKIQSFTLWLYLLYVDNKQDFNFTMAFYYDSKLRENERNPYAFRQLFVYEISLVDKDEDLTFEVESCTTHQSKNGKTLSTQHVENRQVFNKL